MLKKEAGFTLIEMLIVLAVISLLLILVVPNLTDQNENLNKKSEEVLIQMAENQTQAYYIDNGRYPTSIAQLVEEGYLASAELANGSKVIIYDDNNPQKVTIINAPD